MRHALRAERQSVLHINQKFNGLLAELWSAHVLSLSLVNTAAQIGPKQRCQWLRLTLFKVQSSKELG